MPPFGSGGQVLSGPISLAVNGTKIAFAYPTNSLRSGRISVFDDRLQQTALFALSETSAVLAPAANGWIAVETTDSHRMYAYDFDGSQRTGDSVPLTNLRHVALASAPDGQVVIVGIVATNGGPGTASLAFANADLEIESTTIALFGTFTDAIAVVSDGTDFFVGSSGRIAKVTTTRTTTIYNGFPVGAPNDPIFLAWTRRGGVYATPYGSATTLQRFDANGPSGPAITIPTRVRDLISDGDHVLALVGPDPKIMLIGIDLDSGVITARGEVGAGDPANQRLARYGSEVVVAWTNRGVRHIALAP